MKVCKPIIAAAALLIAFGVHAGGEPPGVITEFCAKKLGSDIAGVNQPFNAIDVVKEGVPTRRMLGYFVTSISSFLWYEHGGRGHHQHLVIFNTTRTEEVKASYVFINTKHQSVEGLIKDTEFLRSHVAKDEGL